ncbi:MAG: tRNA uridine-5-carboxymethylaminomethyl(34) synthesis GTPase MnmE [Candidatus Velthaea sp.]
MATPPGRGAIAIVRCSGPDARRIAAHVFRSRAALRDRVATYGTVVDADGAVIDRGLAIAMDSPRTVTGEDVVEFHVHGSPVTAGETLRALVAAGARIAGPGEFTRRAYLNGKLDLSAAEAVADVIAAESRAAARAASANLAGGLRRAVDAARAVVSEALEELAAAVDFPDEVAEPEPRAFAARMERALTALRALVADWERGRIVREGLSLAIVGPPNAGKSSLLNALVGEDRAIVSAIAGTTRDTIEERFAVDGVLVRAVDTAGLHATEDPLERMGVERARRTLDGATVALVVVDGSLPLEGDARRILNDTRGRPRVVLFNKADLGTLGYDSREAPEGDALAGSVFDAQTVAAVRAAVAAAGWHGETIDMTRPHLATARQADAVARGLSALEAAAATLRGGMPIDLAAGDLLSATAALGEISGGAATEVLLDGIFARFCIGK